MDDDQKEKMIKDHLVFRYNVLESYYRVIKKSDCLGKEINDTGTKYCGYKMPLQIASLTMGRVFLEFIGLKLKDNKLQVKVHNGTDIGIEHLTGFEEKVFKKISLDDLKKEGKTEVSENFLKVANQLTAHVTEGILEEDKKPDNDKLYHFINLGLEVVLKLVRQHIFEKAGVELDYRECN